MKIMLNTELVRAIVEKGQIKLMIRMANGSWATQRPYDADLRGQIAALTLAIDALAGKIILQDAVQLDERDFAEPAMKTVDVSRHIAAPQAGTLSSVFTAKT
jgi:hypothetical protein